MIKPKIELLAPAGDFERLEMALHYGADAVYLAGTQFGMRASAGNFTFPELSKATKLAHANGTAVHMTCNTLPREDELAQLPEFLEQAQDAGVDAFIIADLGVMAAAKKYAPKVSRHVSTQLGVINSATANVLFDMGADRVVLARETPMEDIRKIRANTPKELEIEAFVHGAMCVSFSGRCLLSNYLTGRDANRGACAQPCRWKYHLVEEKRPGEYFEISEDKGTHIMNSRDMCMIEHIPELIDAGVTSFKIEGRMKSAYYAAAVTNAYRHAIDYALRGEELPQVWIDELNKVSHRPYCTGFYYGDPGQHFAEASYFSDAYVCAVVEDCADDGFAELTQRNRFCVGDMVELLTNEGEPISFAVTELWDENGEAITATPHAMMKFKMRLPVNCSALSILRRIK
ncbi:MAG: peptidase U32 family protein [Christensenellales bacterium]|nr:U32 family peptidase [Bacillota bacterium]